MQMEKDILDEKKGKRKVSPNSMAASSPSKKSKVPNWSQAEINLAKIIIQFVYNRLEVLVSHIECKEKEREEKECIAMAIDLSKRKTYGKIIQGIKSNVCRIFNYTEIGLLFYDSHGIYNFSFYAFR